MKNAVPIFLVGLSILAAAGGSGCSLFQSETPAVAVPESAYPRPAEGEFSVMTFNLNQYALLDRDGDADTLRKCCKNMVPTQARQADWDRYTEVCMKARVPANPPKADET